jgi:hypothetical protein
MGRNSMSKIKGINNDYENMESILLFSGENAYHKLIYGTRKYVFIYSIHTNQALTRGHGKFIE